MRMQKFMKLVASYCDFHHSATKFPSSPPSPFASPKLHSMLPTDIKRVCNAHEVIYAEARSSLKVPNVNQLVTNINLCIFTECTYEIDM